jgi:hypothetical protein
MAETQTGYLGIVAHGAAGESDFAAVCRSILPTVSVEPDALTRDFVQGAAALAILGGTGEAPLVLAPRVRVLVEDYLRSGKRTLAEFTGSIGLTYSAPPVSTRFDRLVVASAVSGLAAGDVLDLHANARTNPYCTHAGQPPILVYRTNLTAHTRAAGPAVTPDLQDWALWQEEPNLMVCSFRCCNFNRARFAPRQRWRHLMRFILAWLVGEEAETGATDSNLDRLEPVYRIALRTGRARSEDGEHTIAQAAEATAGRAVRWFGRAGMLRDEGRGGVWEGLYTEIDPAGNQKVNRTIRADCTGEAGLSYALDSLLRGNARSLEVSHNLLDLCFDAFQVKEPGPFYGMVRWTDSGWGVCYQDDVARMVIPQMLSNLYLSERRHEAEIAAALDFLVRTTGTDGTRIARTDVVALVAGGDPEAAMAALRSQPGNFPSAHYNAFYHAALLLGSKLYGKQEWADTAIRGLTTIMAAYPETRREQSETEEMCRLVMPLAWLYWATHDDEHRRWLYRVTDDLTRVAHPSGAYLEWDSGYTANCSRTAGAESSLLMRNGDPVVDLLYSMNWLPMGFGQAYLVTGDERFRRLWERVAGFMAAVQLASADPLLDGAWPRAVDVELAEVFAAPNDIGWGPWSIESGWTVAEIASGLMVGCMADRLAGHYGRNGNAEH